MAEPAQHLLSGEEFLDRVWPSTGFFAIWDGKTKRTHWFETPAEAWAKADELGQKGKDVYFSVAAFGEKKRTEKNASSHKVITADLDPDPEDANKYDSPEHAIQATMEWLKTHNFPQPTFFVHSGGGIHLYWVLANSVSTERWKTVTAKFKRALIATGLKVDPVVTADAARIMRMPGTSNHKEATPRPCYVLADTGTTVSLEDFERAIPLVGPRVATPERMKSAYSAGLDDDYPPADFEAIASKCRQMAQAKEDLGKVDEPLWRARLSVLWRCENGEELIHEYSKGDDRYDPDVTEEKARNTAGPHSCSIFNSLNPDGCKGCPFAEKISSPIVLGTDLPEPRTLPDDIAPEERINEFGPWRVTAAGVRLKTTDEDTDEEIMKVVTRCPLWLVEVRERARGEDEPDASSLLLQWHSADGTSKRAIALQSEIYDKRACAKWLADHNLYSQVENPNLFTAFIKEYTYELIKRGKTTSYYDRMGWFGNDFVMAGKKITPQGMVPVRIQSSTSIAQMKPAEGGDATEWGKAVALLQDPKYTWHAFTVLAGLGSPLLELMGWQAAMVSLAGSTGTGKTTAMEMTLSAFADPKHLMMASTATANAIGVQMPALKNLPFGVDEISRWPAWRICDFGYEGPNGEGKASLTQHRDMRQPPRWKLVPMVTTNRPLLDYPESEIDEPIRRRVLELPFGRRELLPGDIAAKLHEAMQKHYGVPGMIYMQHVVRNRDRIIAQLKQVEGIIKEAGGLDDSDRFQRWLLSVALVGGLIAVECGVLPKTFDPMPIVLKVAQHVAQTSRLAVPEEIKIKDAIADFLVQNKDKVVYWASPDPEKWTPGAATDFVEMDVREPLARYDSRTDTISIRSTALKEYLQSQRLSMSNISAWLKEHGVENGKAVRIAKKTPAVQCYVFPATKVGLDMTEMEKGDD